jgi:methylthioribose-1-phosphate isomerase
VSEAVRPIDWVPGDPAVAGGLGRIRLLDQTLLPEREQVLLIDDVGELIDAIARLAVRGAPALGVAGAMGVALLAQRLEPAAVRSAAVALRHARPTAVNLARGVDLALAALPQGPAAVVATALAVRDDELRASELMATRGAAFLYRTARFKQSWERGWRLRLMTICNTGALAAVERGTALSVIEQVWRDGRLHRAIVCETRPLLQGARLTAWELTRLGAPFDLVVDGAAPWLVARGLVDAILVGADRIAANGDTANKVGTFSLSLAARYAAIPFIVVAPESTIDTSTVTGADIEIEDRGAQEVRSVRGTPIAPEGVSVLNPAFDVTPAALVTAIVTDRRVIDVEAGERPDD